MISAAPYRERVVHHALCNIIVPIFERTFIQDSYANRVGFGTHKALKRFTEFARSSRYILQCDLQKYFPSIDHQILQQIIRRKIKCPDSLWLIDRIIDNSNEQIASIEYFFGDDLLAPLNRKKGLPIGNLTSQFFANVMMNPFDHFVKEELKVIKYLRYVDDFALFADDRVFLAEARVAIEEYLCLISRGIDRYTHISKKQAGTLHSRRSNKTPGLAPKSGYRRSGFEPLRRLKRGGFRLGVGGVLLLEPGMLMLLGSFKKKNESLFSFSYSFKISEILWHFSRILVKSSAMLRPENCQAKSPE